MTNSQYVDSLAASVEEEGEYDRAIRRYFVSPFLSVVPKWVKPNTISLLNNAVCWTQVVLAFMSVEFDESLDEYNSGVPRDGRNLDQHRFYALMCRVGMSLCVFFSIILDCADGMHARLTNQTSKLGEVVDHALDASNIPLLAVAAITTYALDKYSVAASVIMSGMVFNSQLTMYRQTLVMLPPPMSGPLGQTILGSTELVFGILYFFMGRWHPWIQWLMFFVVVVFGNCVQAANVRYFWKFIHGSGVFDHAQFAVLTSALGVLYVCDRISSILFCVASVLVAFRLSGCYVLYTVVNKTLAEEEHRQRGEDKPANLEKDSAAKLRWYTPKRILRSQFGSLYSGFDWPCIVLIIVYVVSGVLGIHELTTTYAVNLYTVQVTRTEIALMLITVVLMSYTLIWDAYNCLPVLYPSAKKIGLLRVLF